MSNGLHKSLFVFLLLLPQLLWGQKAGFVTGSVKDMFSEQGLERVKVEIFRRDTIFVDSTRTAYQLRQERVNEWYAPEVADKKAGAVFQLRVPDEGSYQLRLSLSGYQPLERTIDVRFSRRNRYHDVGELWLGKARQHLNEAVVKATKVKMFYNGDTLVYNADAFKLDESSMLEDLVKRLPGVELRGGQIYAHGRFVESITLSGKDFFKGNPQEALKNLPAYVVDKLKFYNKEGELSKTMGADMGDKVYVMDVKLKREYLGTWLARPTLAWGTHHRYSHWLYGMRFDDRQSLTVNVDMNNLNNDREGMGETGSITSTYSGTVMTMKGAKVSYSLEPSERFKLSTYGLFKQRNHLKDFGSLDERYLSPTHQFLQHHTQERARERQAEGQVALALRPRKGHHYHLDYKMAYNDDDSERNVASATYMANPFEHIGVGAIDSVKTRAQHWADLGLLRNHRLEQRLYRGHQLQHSAKVAASWGKSPHLLNLTLGGEQTTAWYETFQRNDLHYFAPATPAVRDYRNIYALDDKRDVKLFLETDYFWKYLRGEASEGQLKPYARGERKYASAEAPYHRLDSLPTWGAGTLEALGTLPSMTDWRIRTYDADNGFTRTDHFNQLRVGLAWEHRLRLANRSWMKAVADVPIALHDHRLYYHHAGLVHAPRRRAAFLQPTLRLEWYPKADDRDGEQSAFSLSYRQHSEMPDLRQTVAVVDKMDPLFVHIGNASLRNVRNHEAKLSYRYAWKQWGASLTANAMWQKVEHAIGMRATYDPTTGVRTTTPENVEGNEHHQLGIEWKCPLDKAKLWNVSAAFSYDHLRSADLNFVQGQLGSAHRVVHNHTFSPELSLSYVSSKTVWAQYVWFTQRVVDSPAADFTRLSMLDSELFTFFSQQLPKGFSFQTTLQMKSMSGLSDTALRQLRMTWDITLKKELLKNLTLSVKWADVLNSQRRENVSVDAQGRRTHYTYLHLPSHVLFSLSYKLKQAPKK